MPVIYESDDDVFWDDVVLRVGIHGQANSLAAGLVVNGHGVEPGPLAVPVSAGGTLGFTWNGPPGQPFALVAGPLNPANVNLPCYGIIDIGTPPFYADIFVMFNGGVPPYGLFFTIGPNGTATFTSTVPTLPPGPLLSVQGIVFQPLTAPCPFVLTAAFQIQVI